MAFPQGKKALIIAVAMHCEGAGKNYTTSETIDTAATTPPRPAVALIRQPGDCLYGH